ncbi:glycosyltransferase [Gulosibacter massiliensis]|uniref:glycosyltransferase n=1 Tax=Gulosibacter massiliensis TaxID=2479839 RepID=UPI000F63CFF0|nr:glycosyltransferase [Gulosibacter massiliensis]
MIGYYIHHHGLGHLARATRIVSACRTPVTAFSSLPRPDSWPGDWFELPDDRSDAPVRPDAGGVLHWAPLDHPGHRRRFGMLAERLAADLDAMVVDVSTEVTLLSRLFGVRTAVVAQRGDRSDRPHRTAWDAADRILAPWTPATAEPWWPQEWAAKTVHLGALSRFDDRPSPAPRHLADAAPAEPETTARRTVLLLWGGGSDLDAAATDAAREATPGWTWRVCTPRQPSPDLWTDLLAADVVVAHGGNNAIAEIAAARRPAVVIAQPRPFDEQHANVSALRRAGCAIGLDAWPTDADWPRLLERALATGGERWAVWHDGRGVDRAAATIDTLAEEGRCGSRS